MRYTPEQRLDIGRQIHSGAITKAEAMAHYGISRSCAESYVTMYKRESGIPLRPHGPQLKGDDKTALRRALARYRIMSHDELIHALMLFKAYELKKKEKDSSSSIPSPQQRRPHMKKPYQPPGFHLIPGVPGMTGDELAALDDAALEKILIDNGFLEQTKRYRANPDFLLRTIAGESILMPTGSKMSGMMLPLSETAVFLWQQLQSPKTLQDIISAAQDEYDDQDRTLETNIRSFIDEHIQSGLVLEVE